MIAFTKSSKMPDLTLVQIDVLVGMTQQEADLLQKVLNYSSPISEMTIHKYPQFEGISSEIHKLLYNLWSTLAHKQ